jgi:pimeloyl-ACP methyl ester carboxylesterase
MRTMTSMTESDRAFVRICDGLVHYRHADGGDPTGKSGDDRALPTILMHASPASSRSVEPLALALASAGRCRVIAPDTPGNGDSAALLEPAPAVGDYAAAMVRMLDALQLERVNLYGFHTGAHIAVEMAIAHPQRVGRIALDGLLWLEDGEREAFLENYAPPLVADHAGTQVFQALQFIRDQAWFFPHFRRDAAHNLGGGAMPPELLHALTVDLLKAAPTYHLAYRAVFRHRLDLRLPMVPVPALLLADESDPTRESMRRAADVLPGARLAIGGEGWSPDGRARKAATLAEFFGA